MHKSKLLFEQSVEGRNGFKLPALDVPLKESVQKRAEKLVLAELSEIELLRHYTALSKKVHGIEDGQYPLGSCTMKYNPKFNESMASLEGFANVHPLQSLGSVEGCVEVYKTLNHSLSSLLGVDDFSFQPAAGAQGELTSLMMIHKYHLSKGNPERIKVIVPDSSHGTNPASAIAAGFEVITIPSNKEGQTDIDALREAVGENTAAMMLTNPNTIGAFDKRIAEMAAIVHEAGGLMYYDGANLNALMGWARPGDMGFDIVHLNLHKTFATPHGGGGPGSGPIGCKKILTPFLPHTDLPYREAASGVLSIGKVKAFHGNFLVSLRALCYVLVLGKEGLKDASAKAVLNANYLCKCLAPIYGETYAPCMHEFALSAENIHQSKGISALDIAKAMLDKGIHPPTIYFPLIVKEAMMFEPTETESIDTLNDLVASMQAIFTQANEEPEQVHLAPLTTVIGRPDEVLAAKQMKVIFEA